MFCELLNILHVFKHETIDRKMCEKKLLIILIFNKMLSVLFVEKFVFSPAALLDVSGSKFN